MPQSLLALLANGGVYSGAALGESLGLSRAAIWKQIQKLEEMGVPLRAIKGVGYQLASPLELLEEIVILQCMSEDAKRHLDKLDVVWSIPSTNAYCFSRMPSSSSMGLVCFAEHQSAGRGRRGRQWASPVAANLYFSIGWRFNGGIETLEGLSLAVGVMIADVLSQEFSVTDVKLKWPNDIFCGQRKLGGVLIEMSGDASGPCDVVIGVGVNVCMPKNTGMEIDQPWTDVCSHTDAVSSRNQMAAGFLNRLLLLLATYESRGFAHYRDRWQEYDVFAGQSVVLSIGENQCIAGCAAGVSDSGGLVIDVDGLLRVFKSGEVSLRRD